MTDWADEKARGVLNGADGKPYPHNVAQLTEAIATALREAVAAETERAAMAMEAALEGTKELLNIDRFGESTVEVFRPLVEGMWAIPAAIRADHG